MRKRRKLLTVLLEYLVIAAGAVLVALAADLFLIPNKVVSGGVSGLAIILYYLIGTPVGLAVLAMNVPLFVAGVRWGGGASMGARTVFAVVVMSVAIDALQPLLPQVTTDPLLYTLYGGLLDGLGMGLVLRFRGTTGGTDIIARLIHRWRGYRIGEILLATNILILGVAAFVFGLEAALYGLIVAFVSSKVIDLVQEGFGYTRMAWIMAETPDEIRRRILEEMERGVTILEGRGGYSEAERQVLLCVIGQTEESTLKQIVREADPNAFVVIGPATEVLGEGFKSLGRPG